MDINRVVELLTLESQSLTDYDFSLLYEKTLDAYLQGYIELEEFAQLRALLWQGEVQHVQHPSSATANSVPEKQQVVRETKSHRPDKPVVSQDSGDRTICKSCKRPLEEHQIFLGERICVECQRVRR